MPIPNRPLNAVSKGWRLGSERANVATVPLNRVFFTLVLELVV